MPNTIDVKDGAGSTVTVNTIDALLTRIGEVQASPTSLTLLDRLKSIAAAAAAPVIAAGTAIIGKVGIDQTTPGTTNKVSIGTDGVVELGATALAALETITVASVTAPLAAGTNAIGKLAANSGVDIGDVDVTSLPSQGYESQPTVTSLARWAAGWCGWTPLLPARITPPRTPLGT